MFLEMCVSFSIIPQVFFFFVMVMDLIWAIVGLKMFGGGVVVFAGVVCVGWLGD